MWENIKAILIGLVILFAIGVGFYFCTFAPMSECMEAHSLAYCHRLLK